LKKITIITLGIFYGILLAGCQANNSNLATPVKVKVQKVQSVNFKQTLTYSGTIEESYTVPLSFSTMGTVAEVYVNEGEFVKKGQLLAKLNNTTNLNAYKMALATKKQAQDAYNRIFPMYQNNTVPAVKFVDISTKLQQAQATAAIAKKNLEDCNLYATISGYVGKRSIEPGMQAMPNVISITLIKIDSVYVRIPVPENEVSGVKKNEKVYLTVHAIGPRTYIGRVEEIGVVADPLAHTYKIKAIINNSDKKLKPGMVCNAILEHNFNNQVLAAPNQAIMVDEKGAQFVYIVDPETKTAYCRYITTGDYLQNGIAVTSGINKGDLLVIEGQQKLADQTLVSIVK